MGSDEHTQRRTDAVAGPAWDAALSYLRHITTEDYRAAVQDLDHAVAREGLGEMNGALGEVCRALMDRIVFEPGTIDVQHAVDLIAARVLEIAGSPRQDEEDRQRALVVFLGSEGLPCAARSQVVSWSPFARLSSLVTLAVGLTALVAQHEQNTLIETVASITPPSPPTPARGTFGLAWRDEEGRPGLLTGVLPRGYTAHITFLGSGTCSLRSIFARVALLREQRPNTTQPRQLGVALPSDAVHA